MAGCRVRTSAALSITCLLMQLVSMVSPGWLLDDSRENFTGFWMNCTISGKGYLDCKLLDSSSMWLRIPELKTFTLIVIALESMAVLLFVMSTIASCFMYCEEKAQCAAICSICNNLVAALSIGGGLALFALKIATNVKGLFVCFYISAVVGLLALINVFTTCMFNLHGDSYSYSF